MIKPKQTLRLFITLALSVVLLASPLANATLAQRRAATKGTPTNVSAPEYSAQLATIEKAIDDKRKELGIPGLSLVIVKDDRVIYMKGLGVKDFDKQLPVTPNTLFAIGSASKAFTAMTAVMTVDQGRLSLDDSPRKYLPYFTLRDPEAAAKITVRDLLAHRSGLNRTDLAMVTNKLNREELIKVAGQAKPTAKLGEKFQYQNIMYAAAGEVVATIQHSTWDKVIANMIFKPLGMTSSDTTPAEMQKAPDYSMGYDYNTTTKQTRRLPQRQIAPAAPAGAINSNARDMAQWLRLMIGGGVINGKRLVSEKNFNELISKQINIGGTVDYGLGWFLRQWNGHKVVEHGGNIDGFNSQVAFMPDQKLGFALMTNVTASTLGAFAMTTVWKNLVGEPKEQTATGPAADPNQEVGKYTTPAGISFAVTMKEGKLTLTVPGQPDYPLQNLGGRRYKLGEPAPDGFFATFRPVKDKPTETELYLEQPQGNIVLTKSTADATASTQAAPSGPLADIVGSYESESLKATLEIGVKEGKVSLVVPGQPPYPLEEKEKNKLRSPNLPEAYWVEVNRDDKGAVAGIVLNQPEGRFEFRRAKASSHLISADELITKMITAYGGEANLRKHKSSVTTVDIDMENQGVQGHTVVSARAPNLIASATTIIALGKTIGTIVSYFDGTNGGELISFAPEENYSGKRLEDIRAGADFYDVLNWKTNYKTITVKRMSKIGDEDVYVVERRNEKGTPVTDHVSAKTFLVLRRDTVIPSDTTGIEIPQSERYSDYREVDGVMVAFKTVSNNLANGNIVAVVKDVKFNVDVPDSLFVKPAK
jgi:CubicO group peptidase (beta-lactamase class C family)